MTTRFLERQTFDAITELMERSAVRGRRRTNGEPKVQPATCAPAAKEDAATIVKLLISEQTDVGLPATLAPQLDMPPRATQTKLYELLTDAPLITRAHRVPIHGKDLGITPPESEGRAEVRHLPVLDEFGRVRDEDRFIREQIASGKWRPTIVSPKVSGINRPMTVFLAHRTSAWIKWAWHGDDKTFCPPIWADIAIGSGACGYGCRACFLMLTWRAMRDPLRPVVYDNGDAFERAVRRWLLAKAWPIDYTGETSTKKVKRWRQRSAKDSIGLGIDCADSFLWEGVTEHARRHIPLFTNPRTNPRGNLLATLTKSANTHYLAQIKDAELHRVHGKVPNVAITMSLNPESIADLWEGKFPDTLERITPPITQRLDALRFAQELGFEVRARIDPILTPERWEEQYEEFFYEMAHVHRLRVTMLTLGTFREKTPQLDTWREKGGLPRMEFEPPITEGRDGTHIHTSDRAAVYATTRQIIERAFEGSGHSPRVSLCKETHDVRKEVDLCNAACNCLDLSLSDVVDARRRLPMLRGTNA